MAYFQDVVGVQDEHHRMAVVAQQTADIRMSDAIYVI